MAEKRSNKNHLRKSARELLVKAVYQWIITDGNSDDLLYQYKQDPDYKKVDKKYFDDFFTLFKNFLLATMSITVFPTAIANGLPPKVEPC